MLRSLRQEQEAGSLFAPSLSVVVQYKLKAFSLQPTVKGHSVMCLKTNKACVRYWSLTWGWARFKPAASFGLLVLPNLAQLSLLSARPQLWRCHPRRKTRHRSPAFVRRSCSFYLTSTSHYTASAHYGLSSFHSPFVDWPPVGRQPAAQAARAIHTAGVWATPPPTLFVFARSPQPSRSLHCRRASNPHLGIIQSLVPVVMLAWFHYDV